jgi:hypothetical protein
MNLKRDRVSERVPAARTRKIILDEDIPDEAITNSNSDHQPTRDDPAHAHEATTDLVIPDEQDLHDELQEDPEADQDQDIEDYNVSLCFRTKNLILILLHL